MLDRPQRRWIAVAVASAVLGLVPAPAAAVQGDTALRLDGDTPSQTAVAWSQVAYPQDVLAAGDGPSVALIGRSDLFADNLAAGVLQQDRPLLLTSSGTLRTGVADELDRLGVTDVTILGGTDAISRDVEDELDDLGLDVDRLAGETRIETAIAIAETVPSDTAILARGFAEDDPTQAFADSLAAGGWAADAGYPVLFTQTEVLTGNTADHLVDAGYERVVIVGGEQAVSAAVEAEVAALVDDVDRVAGDSRFETAVAIAEARGFDSAADADTVLLVDGQAEDAWADGFPAANLAGLLPAPILLTNSAAGELPAPTEAFLTDGAAASGFAQAHLSDVGLICGGTAPADQCGDAADLLDLDVVDFVPLDVAVSPTSIERGDTVTVTIAGAAPGDVVQIAGCGVTITRTLTSDDIDDGVVTIDVALPVDAATGACELLVTVDGREIPVTLTVTSPPTNQDLAITPQEAATNLVSLPTGNQQDRGRHTYTARVGSLATVDVALLPCAAVTVAHDGVVRFRDTAAPIGQADDLGTTTRNVAVIERVGTTTTSTRYVNAAVPQDGVVTVVVDSTDLDCTRPVVFSDADGDNQLDLAADGTPVAAEPFGIGGQKTWVFEEAANGTLGSDQTITALDRAAGQIIAGGRTYSYDGNDVFQVASSGSAGNEASTCTTTTRADFEARMSTGDELDRSSDYRRTGGRSTFCLEDITPLAPTGVLADALTSTTVRVLWHAVAGADGYRVYRSQTAAACPTAPGSYALVATLGTVTQLDDAGRTANTRYCYVVTAIDEGDESAVSAPDDATTLPAMTTPPVSTDAYLDSDAATVGTVGGGDVWRVIVDLTLAPVVNGDTIIVQDAQGHRLNVVCGTNATCTLNTDTVTIAGVALAPGRLLTVVLQGAASLPATNTSPSGNGLLTYPVTIISQSGITDAANVPWTPGDDADNVIDAETKTPAAAPEMAAYTLVNATTVRVVYTEPVRPFDATPLATGQFCYDQDDNDACGGANDGSATGVTQLDAATLQLTFGNGVLPATATEDMTDQLIYLDDNPGTADAGDVVDLSGEPQVNGDALPFS
jgi:putative cell wall-binding protein